MPNHVFMGNIGSISKDSLNENEGTEINELSKLMVLYLQEFKEILPKYAPLFSASLTNPFRLRITSSTTYLLCTVSNSLFRTTDDVTNWVSRLKVSTYERELALFLVSNNSGETTPPHPAKERPYQFMVIDMARSTKANFSQEYVLELLKYRGDAHTYRDV